MITVSAASSLMAGSASAHELGGHWSGGGYANPRVWIKDTTSNAWPVADRSYNWDRSSSLDVFYQYNSCGGDHCVAVYEYNSDDGNDGYTGGLLSNGPFDGAMWTGHYLDGAGQWGHPYVKLNNHYNLNADQRKSVACHEFGHAFGLARHSVDPTCMDGTAGVYHTEVNNHSWADLNGLYGHVTASNPWG